MSSFARAESDSLEADITKGTSYKEVVEKQLFPDPLSSNGNAGAPSGGPRQTPSSFDVEANGARDSAPTRQASIGRVESRYKSLRHAPQSAFLLETLAPDEDDYSATNSEPSEAAVEDHAPTPRKTIKVKERIYYLDWLRILAIYLVVFYHCIQGLDMVGLWPGGEQMHVIAYKSSSLQVGMPVFFHISGRAQALTKQKRFRSTVAQRFQRLIIPFFLGYFLLIPFWQYVQMRDDPEYADAPKWFFLWLFWFVQPKNYKFHTGWLWFLPTLFVIGILAVPIFLFAEERNGKYAAVSIGIWTGFSFLLSVFCGFNWLTLALSALGPILASVVVIFVPFPKRDSNAWSSERWLAVQLTTFLTILTQLGVVCSFRYEGMNEAVKPVPAFILFTGFYVHGYFVQRWNVGAAEAERLAQAARLLAERDNRDSHRNSPSSWDDLAHRPGAGTPTRSSHASQPAYAHLKEKLPLWAGVWQLLVVGIMLLSVSVGSPVGAMERELFPIYSASYKESPFFGAAHIAGTWAMIGLVVSWFQAYANKEFHPMVYKHGTSSVIVVYIFHWAFIAPFTFWVCRDYGLLYGGWKLFDPLMTLVVAVCGSLGLYVLFLRVPALGKLFGM